MALSCRTILCSVSWHHLHGPIDQTRSCNTTQILFVTFTIINPRSRVLQCISLACEFFVVDSVCTTRCIDCGNLCEAFPISDLTSLMLYQSKQCSIVSGDLYIIDLPIDITREVLRLGLGMITAIRGSIRFNNNQFITSMNFFENVQLIAGDVDLHNCPSLVDGLLPSLKNLSGVADVFGCDRLCIERYAHVGNVSDDSSCTNVQMRVFIHIDGDIRLDQLADIESIFTTMVRALTMNTVCMLDDFFGIH